MAKQDVVSKGMDLLAQANESVFESFYDLVVADQPAATPAAPVDASVQAQIDAAVAPIQAKVDDLQKKLDDETALDTADKAVAAQKQQMLDQIKAVLSGMVSGDQSAT